MKKHVLCCTALLLASSAFATITKQQSTALWNQTSTTTCAPTFGSNTGAGNLIVVWTSWQSTNTFTASVQDSYPSPTGDTFASAVGPTLSAASTPTTGQIFYAKNIHGGPDTVTVTYSGSGTVSSASCVIVEYSGADLNYPLDSVSAGYSTASNPTNLLDSGNVAPANSNLMVFAAGVASPNAGMIAGSGFTSLQASNGTWGTGIVENSTTAIMSNNSLQRATACFGSLTTCSTTTGNWLMQMAIFRDASWTVTGGWNPVRPYQVRDATQFPGVDACAQTQSALEIPVSGNSAPVVDMRGFMASTIPCANPPMGTTDSGEIYLPSGVIQTQNSWVMGVGSAILLHGTGRGGPGISEQTVVQPQVAVSGATPSGILQVSSGSTLVEGVGADYLSLDGNGEAGWIGIIDDLGEEQTGFDHIKISGMTVGGALFGEGTELITHGVNFTNFEILPGQTTADLASCQSINAQSITSWSVSSSGVVTVSVSSVSGIYGRNTVIITGTTAGTHLDKPGTDGTLPIFQNQKAVNVPSVAKFPPK